MLIDVIGIENPVMDFNILMDEIPRTDSVSELHDYSWQGGGNVSSAIIAAARLGAKAGMVGVVGDDEFGQFCVDDFKRHGIDTSHIYKETNGKTTFAICLSEMKKMGRSFVGRKGPQKILDESEIDKNYISSAKFIHLGQMGETEVIAAKWAKENGVTVVDDAGYYNELTDRHTDLIDVFIASEHYYSELFDDEDYKKNIKEIQKRGPRIVIVTLGAKGCVGIEGDNYFEIPAFKGVEIVDTTGAGDVFHGAFIRGMLEGWDARKCAEFSSAVSAIQCTCLGGRAGIPSFETAIKFLNEGTIDFTEIKKRIGFYRDGLVNSVRDQYEGHR